MFRQQFAIVTGNAQIELGHIATYYVALVDDRLQATRLFQRIEKLSTIDQNIILMTNWIKFRN